MSDVIDYLLSTDFLVSVVIIAITFVIMWFIKQYLIKKVAYTNQDEKHKNTFIGVLFNALQYLIILIAIFLIMKVNGVDVGGMFTGLGIAATIIGLSLQDTLKDIFSGINIYNNNFYKVGDVVEYKGEQFEVKYFNARVTKLKSLSNQATITLINSSVTEMRKVKDLTFYAIYFDFDTPHDKIQDAFLAMEKRVEELHGAWDAEYFGIIGCDNNGVKPALVYHYNPRNARIPLMVNEIAYQEFKRLGISPSTSDDIKIKKFVEIEPEIINKVESPKKEKKRASNTRRRNAKKTTK